MSNTPQYDSNQTTRTPLSSTQVRAQAKKVATTTVNLYRIATRPIFFTSLKHYPTIIMAEPGTYLTPLTTVLFIFALCTSYMFLSMNGGDFTYVGDYKFILFKVMIIISTIALGFLVTMTSPAYYMFPIETIVQWDMTKNVVVTTFLLYLSSIWLSLAVALLPFGHTVYIGNTNNIDEERTLQLNAIQKTVYSGPYHVLMILMSIGLMVLVIALLYRMHRAEGSISGTFYDIGEAYSSMLSKLHATFGCYFTVGATPKEWLPIAQQFQKWRQHQHP